MNKPDLDMLFSEKGNPCLSLLIPTHRYTRARIQNPELIKQAISKAKELLYHSAWPKDKIKDMESKLDSTFEKIDYIRMQEGLAIYISANICKIFLLPFPIKEKVMLGKTFEVRDIIYFSQFLKPYLLLAISKKIVRLFKGTGRDLQEVRNNDFPKKYIEEYEYEHPSIGSSSSSSLKAFERDKSVLREIRITDFLRQTDGLLNKYLKSDSLLFVAGVEEQIVNFRKITNHIKNMAGSVEGNYDVDALHPLAETAWKKIQEDVRHHHRQFLIKLQEDIGKKLAIDGIRDVWQAAQEGKGNILLLEKDYQVTGYINQTNTAQLFLKPPVGQYDIITDAADDVIEIVKEKGGQIVIVENGFLGDFGHVALLLRYP